MYDKMCRKLYRELQREYSDGFFFENVRDICGQNVDISVMNHMYACKEMGIPYTYHCDVSIGGVPGKIGEFSLSIGSYEELFYLGHIGYFINEKYRGNHYAGEACKTIKLIAKAHNLDTLYITCENDNIASKKTCRYIGADFLHDVQIPKDNRMYKDGFRVMSRYKWDI